MTDLRWYVVRTNPQCETRAQVSIEAAGFDTFLPKMRKETRHPRTKVWRTREYPLLTRYLFLGMEKGKEHWGYVRQCDGVECVLGINGTPLMIASSQVAAFMKAQAAGEFDQMRRSSTKRPYRVADPVMITAGPFEGYHGEVRSVRGKQMVEIMIDLLGGMVPVSVPEKNVEIADSQEQAA